MVELIVNRKNLFVEDVNWFIFDGFDSSKITFRTDLIDWKLCKVTPKNWIRLEYEEVLENSVFYFGFRFRGQIKETIDEEDVMVEITTTDYEADSGADLTKIFTCIMTFAL